MHDKNCSIWKWNDAMRNRFEGRYRWRESSPHRRIPDCPTPSPLSWTGGTSSLVADSYSLKHITQSFNELKCWWSVFLSPTITLLPSSHPPPTTLYLNEPRCSLFSSTHPHPFYFSYFWHSKNTLRTSMIELSSLSPSTTSLTSHPSFSFSFIAMATV